MVVTDASDSRLAKLTQWVIEDLGFAGAAIAPASADASFRRYFRVVRGADSFIVMDAPPDKEDSAPFVKVILCTSLLTRSDLVRNGIGKLDSTGCTQLAPLFRRPK